MQDIHKENAFHLPLVYFLLLRLRSWRSIDRALIRAQDLMGECCTGNTDITRFLTGSRLKLLVTQTPKSFSWVVDDRALFLTE